MRFALALLAALLPAAALAQTLVTPPDFKTPSRATQGVTKGYVDSATSTLGTAVGLKADKTYVDTGLAGKVPEAPNDGTYYVRRNNGWTASPTGTVTSSAITTALGFTPVNKTGDTLTGQVRLEGSGTALTDIHTSQPANGVFLSHNGATWDYCSVTGCLPGPHLLGGNIFNMTTRSDATAQESNVSLNTVSQTGKAEDWQASHAYTAGTQIHGPGLNDGIYQATTSGTSGSTGPAGTGSSISDGSVVWQYKGEGINDGKSGFSNAMYVLPGAGHTWGMNSSLHINAGVGRVPMFGFEFDTTNANMDYAVGGPIMANIYLNGSHNYPGTAAIYASMSGPIASYAWHYGVLFQGDQYVKDATIADATSSSYVLYALGAPHTHAAVIRDDTNSTRSLDIGGSHTIGIDMTRGSYGTAITLPTSNYIGFAGQSNLIGYNSTLGALTYGVTNSGTAYGFASFANNDFVVGHHLSAVPSNPGVSGCGSGASINSQSNDTHGTLTLGSGATGCTVTFVSGAYSAAPDCVIMAFNSGAPVSAVNVLNNAFTFATGGSPAGQKYSYICMGR